MIVQQVGNFTDSLGGYKWFADPPNSLLRLTMLGVKTVWILRAVAGRTNTSDPGQTAVFTPIYHGT